MAHQGGWDEALVFVAPVALLAALVWVATVVAQRRAEQGRSAPAGDRREGHRSAP